jgi:hypothetical protein
MISFNWPVSSVLLSQEECYVLVILLLPLHKPWPLLLYIWICYSSICILKIILAWWFSNSRVWLCSNNFGNCWHVIQYSFTCANDIPYFSRNGAHLLRTSVPLMPLYFVVFKLISCQRVSEICLLKRDWITW